MQYLLYLFAGLMVLAGINHLVNPRFYRKFIPKPFPKKESNILAGIVEIGIGVILLFPA